MSDKRRGAAKAGEGNPSDAPVGKSAPRKGRPVVDWASVERDYRAGIKTLRQMAEEHGISHVAIAKRAKTDGWTRDLTEKIQQKARDLVNRQLVTSEVTKEDRVTEKQVVDANASIVADADLLNRKDVVRALEVNRTMLEELATLSRPEFAEALEMIGQANYMPDRSGRDPTNELYRYIISLAGRVKMSKDLAGAMGVYIPMQRKILKLDEEADKNKAAVDDLLRKINQGA